MVVIPLWFTTVLEKLEEAETWSWYEVAPAQAFHFTVGLVLMPVAPFEGDVSVGTDGELTAVAVVKLQVAE